MPFELVNAGCIPDGVGGLFGTYRAGSRHIGPFCFDIRRKRPRFFAVLLFQSTRMADLSSFSVDNGALSSMVKRFPSSRVQRLLPIGRGMGPETTSWQLATPAELCPRSQPTGVAQWRYFTMLSQFIGWLWARRNISARLPMVTFRRVRSSSSPRSIVARSRRDNLSDTFLIFMYLNV